MSVKPKPKVRHKPISKVEWETKNENQRLLSEYIRSKRVTIGVGPAGTGKSYSTLYTAVDLFNEGKIGEIIVSRPLIAVGQELGFLPGDVTDKTSPYMDPLFDVLYDHPQGQMLIEGTESPLTSLPVALMRGMTVNSLLIIDEAQNLTRAEFKMLLTRLGKDGRIVILGDTSQTDLRPGQSGLNEMITGMKHDPDVGYVKFTENDICRADFVGRVIKFYYELEQRENSK